MEAYARSMKAESERLLVEAACSSERADLLDRKRQLEVQIMAINVRLFKLMWDFSSLSGVRPVKDCTVVDGTERRENKAEIYGK